MGNYSNPWLNSSALQAALPVTTGITPLAPGLFVTPQDHGAKGDGQSDDTQALLQWAQVVQTGSTPGYVPAGIYLTTQPIVFKPVSGSISLVWVTSLGARIKASASMPYVMCFDYSGGGVGFAHGGHLSGLVLDGGGYAVDGLSVKGVVAGVFNDIRITNVTGAGLHASLPNGLGAQDCVFNGIVVSSNYEAFTTQPVNGILLDNSASNQANIFYNPIIECVSGDGIKLLVGGGNNIYGGTTEGNGGYGLRMTVSECLVVGTDIEVNIAGDVLLDGYSGGNVFVGLVTGGDANGIALVGGARYNNFLGGLAQTLSMDATTTGNRIESMAFLAVTAGAAISDSGNRNSWRNCIYDAGGSLAPISDKLLSFSTISAPAYIKGGIYFDTTLNKLRVGGAAGWETVTSI